MKIKILDTTESVAECAAEWIARSAHDAVRDRSLFTLALSGGSTPGSTLRALAKKDLPWHAVRLFQVDERVAPAGHADRNWTHLRGNLLDRIPLDPAHAYPMPVEEPDLKGAARAYSQTLTNVTGTPIVFDVVQLGLGTDGHTASLPPGDPILEVTDLAVTATAPFLGYQRMTLTLATLSRARKRLWIVTGDSKEPMLARLLAGDPSIPAGRVRTSDTSLFTNIRTMPGTHKPGAET